METGQMEMGGLRIGCGGDDPGMVVSPARTPASAGIRHFIR
jgi:hypothetical protein